MRTHVKINLGLQVTRRRPDGFHDLETLFVPYYGLGDDLEITLSDSLRVEISGADWDPMQDLTVKAWNLMKDEFPEISTVCIKLNKGVPVGAGLGGGSADAAFTLKALNSIFSLGLDSDALAERAARLGSDCAFFIYDRPMLGSGRGDILEPFDLNLDNYDIRVEVPSEVRISTREAYSGIIASDLRPEGTVREILSRPIECWKNSLKNDFEISVFAAHPEIAALKQKMYNDGAVYAAMSGSGSAVFGIFAKTDK